MNHSPQHPPKYKFFRRKTVCGHDWSICSPENVRSQGEENHRMDLSGPLWTSQVSEPLWTSEPLRSLDLPGLRNLSGPLDFFSVLTWDLDSSVCLFGLFVVDQSFTTHCHAVLFITLNQHWLLDVKECEPQSLRVCVSPRRLLSDPLR